MLTAGIAGIAKKIFMELSQSFDFNLLANFLSNVTNSLTGDKAVEDKMWQ